MQSQPKTSLTHIILKIPKKKKKTLSAELRGFGKERKSKFKRHLAGAPVDSAHGGKGGLEDLMHSL